MEEWFFGTCNNKNRLEYVYGCSFGLENVIRAQFKAQMQLAVAAKTEKQCADAAP
jgi:hypothetical protein